MGLGKFEMKHQPTKTSCWITVAHFCMKCLGTDGVGGLNGLVTTFQKLDSNSASAMDGAGKPETVLDAHNVDVLRVSVPSSEEGRRRLATLAEEWLAAGKPVIAGLKSGQVSGWAHAVVLVGATKNGVTLAYKDPGGRRPDQPVYIASEAFFSGYQYANVWHMDIFAYCRWFIFVGEGATALMETTA